MSKAKPTDPDELRDRLATLAQTTANTCGQEGPPGCRVVVMITDAEGAWVGVGSNTAGPDAIAIISSALSGADFRSHPIVGPKKSTDG